MFRYAGEWEKQSATWLSCPHNKKEWKDKLPGIKEFYKNLIDVILDFQDVKLILSDEKFLAGEDNYPRFREKKKHKLHKIIIPNNDVWIRDYGPFFMKCKGEVTSPLRIVDFEFNAWGGKYPPWNLDYAVPRKIAFFLGEKCESYPIILEGGAIDFNGDDLAITTEECVLNQNRNPNVSKMQTENLIKDIFNIKKIIWLKRGLEGDHTDGHVDNVARFIGKNKILINKGLETKKEILKWAKNHDRKLEIVELPLPKFSPASYVNFIFVNGGVIIPIFNCNTDKEALAIFKKVFPTRKVVGVDCSLLIQEGGGLHCMTKQEPL